MYKSVIKDGFFCYATALITAFTTGTTQTPAINFSNDSDFEVYEIRAVIYKLAARTGSLLMTISLASGELFGNVAIDVFSFAAQNIQSESGYPIRLPIPTRIPANSQLNVQLTNNTGANVDVQIQLWGRKCEVAQ